MSSKSSAVRKNALDGLAIGVSAACMVHCLALPALIALLPAWSAWLDVPEEFHLWVLLFALPFSLAVLVRAAGKRLWYAPLWLGIAGLAVMALGLAFHDSAAEPVITSLGAVMLAGGHIMNWRRRCGCRA